MLTGAGIHVGNKILPNNSLITTVGHHTIPIFHCLSGSLQPNVGMIIGPQGRRIISDPFSVIQRGSYDPGSLFILGGRSLEREDTGIYTYVTPDESGNQIKFFFGIYHSNHSGLPVAEFT